MFYLYYVYFPFNSVHMTYDRLLPVLYSSLWTCTILVLGKIFPDNNYLSFRYLPTFSLSFLLVAFLFVYRCTRVLSKRNFTSKSAYVYVRVCMYMGIRRKSYDVLPATGPSWFPPLATTLRGVKRRQNDRGWNDREEPRDEGRSRNAPFVLCLGLTTKSLCQFGCNANMQHKEVSRRERSLRVV